MTLERVAITALMGMSAYVALTVQTLAVDVAVLKSHASNAVTPATFTAFSVEVRGDIDRQNQWLDRLSVRLNKLETDK